MKNKVLYRSRTNRKLAGICGGLAKYTGWDANLIRISLLVITVLPGPSVIFYLLAWVLLPLEPSAAFRDNSTPILDKHDR